MDCKEITISQKLVAFFREENESHLNMVFKCFFNLFFADFRRLTHKYCADKIHAKYKEEELASDAFNDGLLSFYLKLKKDGFEEKGAQVKTAFFSFCIFKLKGLTKALGRRFSKETIVDPLLPFNELNLPDSGVLSDHWNYEQLLDNEEEILRKALKKLGERGTDLLMWKKILKLKNEEIAGRMNIKPDTVPNEVYKSFIRLKELVKGLKAQ
jgi:DNA-directed RNA polymerase specialized sigma24 family protein